MPLAGLPNASHLYRGIESGECRSGMIRSLLRSYHKATNGFVSRVFQNRLYVKTNNFSYTHWLGVPLRQNVLDLWTLQQTLHEVQPALIVECGTNEGGSAVFYAKLLDTMHGQGRGNQKVLSIDIENAHVHSHPRVEFFTGDSLGAEAMARASELARKAQGPVLVILDSDHSAAHVRKEMEAYAGLVTPGSFLHVQDGHVDTLRTLRRYRPGPLAAIRSFLCDHSEFEADEARSERFLVTDHPMGWLQRKH